MKRLLLAGLAVYALTGVSAHAANVVIEGVIGTPAPVYVAPPPPPVVVYPGYIAPHPYVTSYDPHHRAHDWKYWQDHRYDHRDDHHR